MVTLLRFENYINDIKKYCAENKLSYDKLQQMVHCVGQSHITFVHRSKDKGEHGLLDETPALTVLTAKLIENKLVVEETPYTRKYLAL